MKKYMKQWLFLLAVVFLLAGCQKKLSLEEYLDLGEKYLSETNYEEAIIAFTKAIELEPRTMKAYTGLVNVYIRTADYEKAKEILKNGISVYEGLTAEEQEKDEYKQGYDELLELQEELKMLENLQAAMISGDRESIWQLQASEKYQAFITRLSSVITRDCGDGNWFLIYPCGHCYYGGMKDGKRSGQGIWCAYDYVEGEKTFDSCTWSDDYPNGDGEKWSVCLAVPWDLFHTSFTLKDGLYHGTVQQECNSTYSGETFFENYSYECSDGIAAEVEDLHPREIQGDSDKERYCIYSDNEQSHYAVRGYKKGILHAKKGIDAVDSTKAYSEEELQDSKQSVEEELKAWEEENLDEGAEDAPNEE